MNLKIWFVLNEGKVTGPLDKDEVEAKIPQLKDVQIWGRGYSEWMPPSRWHQAMQETPPATKGDIDTQHMWKVRVDATEKPAMSYPELMAFLKTQKDLSTVDLKFGNADWTEIFNHPKVIEDLGVSRRSHPRVPIVGTLNCKLAKGEASFRVISISQGGLGLNEAQNLRVGERFPGVLNSPNLYASLHANFEVVYVGNDGYAGLRFTGLPEEFKSSIIEYVNKFAAT